MRRYTLLLLIMSLIGLLSGCSANRVKSPCSDFGHYCNQVPVNVGPLPHHHNGEKKHA